LDEICESYLEEKYDVKIDFAIEESLPRLLRDGLVERSDDPADPRLHAVDINTAHERLLKLWQTYAHLKRPVQRNASLPLFCMYDFMYPCTHGDLSSMFPCTHVLSRCLDVGAFVAVCLSLVLK
jgi:hypothetical protein